MLGLQRKAYRYRFALAIVALLGIIAIIFFGTIRMLVMISILLGLNILISHVSRHIPRFKTSLELIMFGTVLVGLAYGGKIGALYGIIASITYYYAAGRFSYFVIIFAPLYALAGLLVPFFSWLPLFTLGISFVIGYTIFSSILIVLVFNGKIDKMIGFLLINTFFNVIMFKYFAPLFLLLMR